ncbi:MAG: prepilin-type N-terminal cleavage/methylation domain-containing protein, partial [Sandarakinorhabdus sp.]|nr:prepilin-type N-terminal cleavage/methylation domain-containing protein [Sandarakinorhabdus sp.]
MRQHSEAGFTLVELLVSLVLLTMTALLLLATMTTGHGLERRSAARMTAAESVAAAHLVLRDRIETILPDVSIVPGGSVVDVTGDERSFSFTAPPAAAVQPAPPQRFRLLLTRAGEMVLFSIDPLSTRADPDAISVAGWQRTPLLGNVVRLDIAYFGAAPPDNQRRWRLGWRSRPALPELVRIRVGFAPGDPRIWPD